MSPRWRLVGEGLKVEEAPEPSGDGSLEEFAHREKAVADLFYLWDLDHDYVVDPKEMAMVWWATNIFLFALLLCCFVSLLMGIHFKLVQLSRVIENRCKIESTCL